jgi:hypothetical protein
MLKAVEAMSAVKAARETKAVKSAMVTVIGRGNGRGCDGSMHRDNKNGMGDKCGTGKGGEMIILLLSSLSFSLISSSSKQGFAAFLVNRW